MPVRHAILALLAQRPRHGYELHSAFEALVGGQENWDVKPAQVYMTLSRLQEAGLVAEDSITKDGGPEKKTYCITALGQAELVAWYRTGVLGEHQRDEFYLKLLLSLREKSVDTRQLLQTQRATLYQELHHVTTGRAKADPRRELAQILLMDKTVMHLEADLRWLEMIEARLDDMERQPQPEPEVRPRGRPKKE